MSQYLYLNAVIVLCAVIVFFVAMVKASVAWYNYRKMERKLLDEKDWEKQPPEGKHD